MNIERIRVPNSRGYHSPEVTADKQSNVVSAVTPDSNHKHNQGAQSDNQSQQSADEEKKLDQGITKEQQSSATVRHIDIRV